MPDQSYSEVHVTEDGDQIGHAVGWSSRPVQGLHVWTAYVGPRNFTGTADTKEAARAAAEAWIERER